MSTTRIDQPTAKPTITREFLGLDRPGLEAASDYLFERFATERHWDLSELVLVVPGSRAGRRMIELLALRAAERKRLLVLPEVKTVGQVAELLYHPKREFANELTQQLVWAEVLRDADEAVRRPLLPYRPDDRSKRWRELAAALRSRHIELAGDGVDFAIVAEHAETFAGAAECERWKAMARLQDAYHHRLDALDLWDRQTARLRAIEFEECTSHRPLLLIGTVDMNAALKRMLNQVAEQVTALILAPPSWDDRFDEYGALIPECWQELPLEIDENQVTVVDRPRDQAAAVIRQLAAFDGRYHVDEVTIGVPDDSLIPDLQQQLQRHSISSRSGRGRSLAESLPYRLLAAVRDLLRHQRFADLAQVMRHPDIEDWLAEQGVAHYLPELDDYRRRHLPLRVPRRWLSSRGSKLRQAVARLESLLTPLMDGSKPLSAWREILGSFLGTLYKQREFDTSHPGDQLTLKTIRAFIDAWDEQFAVPAPLIPEVDAAEAIELALELVGRARQPVEAVDAIELLGWLELPLDDAPALIVTGLNDGFVPESVNSDLFLPNGLRQRLGLLDNRRRYARDAYALQVLLRTRESVHLIAGRRTADGDPLLPSRLLFATSAEQIAARAIRFFSTPADEASGIPTEGSLEGDENELAVPRPDTEKLQPITQLRVTAFRDYLACPYRFYLRHLLALEPVDDRVFELDGAAFGTAAHEVLRRFGESELRDSQDGAAIQAFLEAELSQYTRSQYGSDVVAAVRVQIEQLKLRLAAFAAWQARHRGEGWQIESVETSTSQSIPFVVDGEAIELRGRIDRIDVHEETGQRMVVDYKTSDRGDAPEKTHLRGGRWIDLQLPLYRHLAGGSTTADELDLAYLVLPRDTAKTGLLAANWSSDDLERADEVARDVIRRIRNYEFWPPAQPPPDFSGAFAAICQDRVLGR